MKRCGSARGAASRRKCFGRDLIQYLVLDKTDAERPNFEGAKFVMSPPLRDKTQSAGAVEWLAQR